MWRALVECLVVEAVRRGGRVVVFDVRRDVKRCLELLLAVVGAIGGVCAESDSELLQVSFKVLVAHRVIEGSRFGWGECEEIAGEMSRFPCVRARCVERGLIRKRPAIEVEKLGGECGVNLAETVRRYLEEVDPDCLKRSPRELMEILEEIGEKMRA